MDLVAAGNGRVFAKAADRDEFYFATLDEMFVAARPDGSPLAVPSTYFKLDPQFNQPGARDWDLTTHLAGCFGDHPAAERFPHLFWPLLEQGVMDGMVVRVERGKWHRLDPRPPFSRLQIPLVLAELARRLLPLYPPALLNPLALQAFSAAIDLVKAIVERLGDQTGDVAPPAWTPPLPTFAQVIHCRTDVLGTREIPLLAVRYERVLDVGVGHVHWCEQYQPIYGGELQPLRTGRLLGDPFPSVTYADLYQIFNGPIRDGDGFIDGTCNYYTMVQLRPDPAPVPPTAIVTNPQQPPDTYAILYHDEQFYFTQRWRLVHPDDFKGPMFALVKDLDEDTRRGQPLYRWRKETYWCPFRAGQVGPRSRMAVAAQVLLVTGGDPPDGGQPLLFSTNFSYATMDRTWRWRALPAPAATSGPRPRPGTRPSPATRRQRPTRRRSACARTRRSTSRGRGARARSSGAGTSATCRPGTPRRRPSARSPPGSGRLAATSTPGSSCPSPPSGAPTASATSASTTPSIPGRATTRSRRRATPTPPSWRPRRAATGSTRGGSWRSTLGTFPGTADCSATTPGARPPSTSR